MYRKSILFEGTRQVKNQHRWLPLSARLRPSSIFPTDTAINYPRNIGTMDMDGGRDQPMSRETPLDMSWPSSHHISPAVKFSGRLPPTCFPALAVASGSVGETSGCVVYMGEDFVEDVLSLLCLFMELALLTTV